MISAQHIIALAKQQGFDDCATAIASRLDDDANYMEHWIGNGLNAQLGYLEQNREKRYDPRCLVPGAKTIVVVVLSFEHSGRDYHRTMKSKLYRLEAALTKQYGTDIVAPSQHIFCDSAPFLERQWAVRAGLGQIGRNRQFIHPRLGSKVHLAELVLNSEVHNPSPDPVLPGFPDACLTCAACQEACPTGALRQTEWQVNLCTAYTTFHCLVCQDICPINRQLLKNNTI